MELVDTPDLGSGALGVRVRVSSSASDTAGIDIVKFHTQGGSSMANAQLEIQKENLEGSKIKIAVKASKEVVSSASKSVAKQVLKHIRIPGFRKDKTPLVFVKRHIGAERFDEYVQHELLPKTYYDALEQEGLQPISEVVYAGKKLSDGGFEFEATFAVAPELSLPDYKGLKVEPEAVEEISDEKVNDFLEDLRQKRAEAVDVAEGTEAAEGHRANVLVRGKIDGEDSDFLKHYNTSIRLGQEDLYPGLDAQVLGKKKLDRFECEITFPEDWANKALAGKTASLEVKILALKDVKVPELDAEFFSQLGGFETLEDVKTAIRRELESQEKQAAARRFRSRLQDALYEATSCEVPGALIEELTEAKLHDLKMDLEQRRSTYEDWLKAQGKTAEDHKVELDKDSERELKLSFVLTEISLKEGETVEDREILQRIQYTALMLRKDFHEIMDYVESLGRRVLIRAEILQEKALHLLERHYDPTLHEDQHEEEEEEHVHGPHCNHDHHEHA